MIAAGSGRAIITKLGNIPGIKNDLHPLAHRAPCGWGHMERPGASPQRQMEELDQSQASKKDRNLVDHTWNDHHPIPI
jgi:hypothetical protein